MVSVKKSLLPFSLLFILLNVPIRCQETEDKRKETPRGGHNDSKGSVNFVHATGDESDNNSITRPYFSNIEDDIFSQDYYGTRIRYFRTKRDSAGRSLAAIKKQLNEEKRKEEKMAAHPRMENNDTEGIAMHGISDGKLEKPTPLRTIIIVFF